MQIVSRLVIAYAINAVWQLPLLVLAAEVVVRLLGRARAKVLYRIWLGCLVLALTLPALPFAPAPLHIPDSTTAIKRTAMPAKVEASESAKPGGHAGLHLSFAADRFTLPAPKALNVADLPNVIATSALWFYLTSVLFALLRLAWGLRQTHSLLSSAETASLNPEMRETWESCLTLFGQAQIRLMSSPKLASPATLSWPDPIVLLPTGLRDEEANEMTAVFSHELAHVRRGDFLCNIFIELFAVALFFHPAFHWMRRRIQETRELACDDMAAEAILGRHVYARTLLRLTQRMLSAAVNPQPGYTLGIFEGEILERRIMNLLENKSKHTRLRVFCSVALAVCLLLGTCMLSSRFGFRPVSAEAATETNSAPSGWLLAGSKPANYQSGVDNATVQNGKPSAYLKSALPATDGFGTLMQMVSASEYAGKRVRLRAWVKSQEVGDWAGVWMRVDKENTMVGFDNMQNRSIKGTQPWQQYDVVLDVPQGATDIAFGVLLTGAGEVWMNDVSFEVVGTETPTTNLNPSQSHSLPTHPSNLSFSE